MPEPFVHVAPGRLRDVGAGDRIELAPDDDHHVRRVLRLAPGAPLELCDGRGRTAAARLTASDVALVTDPVAHPPPPTAIEVVHALPKGRKLDEVVRVLCELGVDRIRPVASARSVVRLDGPRAAKAGERWRAVARAAAGQSRRPFLPVVDDPCGSPELAAEAGTWSVVAHVDAPTGLATALRGRPPATRVRIAVGPEGGWTDDEVAAFADAGAEPVHLGAAVLRTEHAAAAAVAVVAAAVGYMD